MANKPKITLGLPDHPRCQAIIDGKVGIEGYELDVDPNFVSSGERHYKYLHGEWDVGEVSAASLLRAIEKGQQLLAIPVFFERGPRQRNIYHCENHLKHPSELKGKKFGCFRYGATAVVWARGYLLDAHNIKTTDMQWFVSGREVFIGHELPVKVQRIEPPPPFGGEKLVLSKMLNEGELHGAVVPGDNGYAGFFGGGETPKMMAAYAGGQAALRGQPGNYRLREEDRHQSDHARFVDPPRSRRTPSRLSRRNSRAPSWKPAMLQPSTCPPKKSPAIKENATRSAKIPTPTLWVRTRNAHSPP